MVKSYIKFKKGQKIKSMKLNKKIFILRKTIIVNHACMNFKIEKKNFDYIKVTFYCRYFISYLKLVWPGADIDVKVVKVKWSNLHKLGEIW